jgi:DNA-binding NarL/FixJ family response regulator
MLRELLGSAIGEADDMSVVGTVDDATQLTASVMRTNADVLVTGVPDDGGALERILYDRPRLILIAIGGNGRSTALHELRPHEVTLGDVSPAQLVEAIRVSSRARAH